MATWRTRFRWEGNRGRGVQIDGFIRGDGGFWSWKPQVVDVPGSLRIRIKESSITFHQCFELEGLC